MWFFPVLSIFTLAGITAVLVQMAFDRSARSQLWLSLLSWAVVVGLYFAARTRGRVPLRAPGIEASARLGQQHRLLERQPARRSAASRGDVRCRLGLGDHLRVGMPKVLPLRRIRPPPAAVRFFSQSRSGP